MQAAALFKAVREHHPKASKKEVRLAAFYALILLAEANPLKVAELYDFALRARAESKLDDD